jgi:hypothetical protein
MRTGYKVTPSLSPSFRGVLRYDSDASHRAAPPPTLDAVCELVVSAHARQNLDAYSRASRIFQSFRWESSDEVFQNVFRSDFLPFLISQIRDPPVPAALKPALEMLNGLLMSSNPSYSHRLLELRVLDLLNPFLELPDYDILLLTLTCMAYSFSDLARLHIPYRYAIDSERLESLIRTCPALEETSVQLTEYFLCVPQMDDYSADLFRFLLTHYSPRYPAKWAFRVTIDWIKRVHGFRYNIMIETGFLSKKMRHYIRPGPTVAEMANKGEIGGCSQLQWYSLRFLRACACEFQEFREHCHELILPEDIVTIMNDPGSEDKIVAAGLKLMAELCRCPKMQVFLERLEVAEVVNGIMEWGAYRSRVNCWRLAQAWIEIASPAARNFLFAPALLHAAADQIDADAPKLSLTATRFLITVFETAIKMKMFEISRDLGTKALEERLEEISEAYPRTELSDRAMALVRMIGEAQTAENYCICSSDFLR